VQFAAQTDPPRKKTNSPKQLKTTPSRIKVSLNLAINVMRRPEGLPYTHIARLMRYPAVGGVVTFGATLQNPAVYFCNSPVARARLRRLHLNAKCARLASMAGSRRLGFLHCVRVPLASAHACCHLAASSHAASSALFLSFQRLLQRPPCCAAPSLL
jgi:hypothetical protein